MTLDRSSQRGPCERWCDAPRNKRSARHSISEHGRRRPDGRSAENAPVARATIVVRNTRQLQRLEAELVGARGYPVVLLALAVDADEPVFPPGQLRRAAGLRLRIYLLQGQHPFQRPAVVANQYLAVPRGSARICWPQFSVSSDPDDHPVVHRLEGESDRDALKEFARQFDLSRPCVRQKIKLIEGIRATSERELAQVRLRLTEVEQQLRDAYIARDQASGRDREAQQPSRPSDGR